MTVHGQDAPATQEEADKLDSLVVKLMNYKRYDDALTAKLREVDILKQLRGEKDSAYLCNKAFLGKIYYRLRRAEEAAKITTEAAEEYGKHIYFNEQLIWRTLFTAFMLSGEKYRCQ